MAPMSDPSLQPGALIAGRYRLERLLGEGGMAIVWEATHTVTKRTVAMKFLREALRDKEELRVRFHREASAASALRHPNVVEILDVFDFEAGAPVMVMELLHGETLGQKLARDEKLSLEETAALMLPVISAVGAAHALGIVHRDLKPDNVFLASGPTGTIVKVLDFGIAKLTTGVAPRAMHTAAGSMLGTPYYMAPEQASSNMVVDYRADIWSLGVILYECLAGTRPIEGDDLVQVVTRLVSVAIMPLERIAPELPHDVSSVVMQMLTRDPLRRPADLAEVSKLLATYTRVVAPPFGAPSTGKSWAASGTAATSTRPPEARAGEPAPAARTDPRGPTLLSSTPPVPSSVTVVGPDTRAAAGRSNKPLLLLAAGALAIVAALVVLVRYGSSHDGPGPVAAPLEKASSGPAVTMAPSVAPLEPVTDAAAPASSPATTSAHKVAVQRTRPAARAATVPLAASHAPPPPEVAVSKPLKDESTLFSGRK